jgi:hypothetical protein
MGSPKLMFAIVIVGPAGSAAALVVSGLAVAVAVPVSPSDVV